MTKQELIKELGEIKKYYEEFLLRDKPMTTMEEANTFNGYGARINNIYNNIPYLRKDLQEIVSEWRLNNNDLSLGVINKRKAEKAKFHYIFIIMIIAFSTIVFGITALII